MMHWLFIAAAPIVFALAVGGLMALSYQEAEAFMYGFFVTLAIEGVLLLIAWLLWMGLKGYVGS